MSKKIVCYTGATSTHYPCSNPDVLVVGRKYEVVSEEDKLWQTDYILKDVEGHFNSCWFQEVVNNITYIAVSNIAPAIGHRYQCAKLEFANGKWGLTNVNTSMVMDVHKIGDNIYQVITVHSVYIVQLGKISS